MKYKIAIIMLLSIVIGIFIYANKDAHTYPTLVSNKKKLVNKIENEKLKQDSIDISVAADYINQVNEVPKVDLPPNVLEIRNDLQKLNPCDFLEKYKLENDKDLFLALNGIEVYNNPLSLLYLDKIPPDLIELHLNDIPRETSLFLLNRNIEEMMIYPNDIYPEKKSNSYLNELFKNHNALTEKEKKDLELLEYLTYKNESVIDNILDSVDGALDDIDSHPLEQLVLASKSIVKYKIKRNENEEKLDNNLIKLKVNSVMNDRVEGIYNNILDRIEDKRNDDNPSSILALETRDSFLKQANNPTETALLYYLYNRQMNSHLDSFLNILSYTKDYRPQSVKKIKKYLNEYNKNIQKSKDVNLINKELFNIMKVFNLNITQSFDEYTQGMKGLYDPIYGSGCDDRRYKDICTKYCNN